MAATKPKSWPIIHFSPNDPHPRDLVTDECAEDINIGDELIAVCEEMKQVGGFYPSSSPEWWVLDWGTAILCRCTGKSQSQTDGLWLITAEPIPLEPIKEHAVMFGQSGPEIRFHSQDAERVEKWLRDGGAEGK